MRCEIDGLRDVYCKTHGRHWIHCVSDYEAELTDLASAVGHMLAAYDARGEWFTSFIREEVDAVRHAMVCRRNAAPTTDPEETHVFRRDMSCALHTDCGVLGEPHTTWPDPEASARDAVVAEIAERWREAEIGPNEVVFTPRQDAHVAQAVRDIRQLLAIAAALRARGHA